MAAVAVPLWAIYQQHRTITMQAAAEDDCPYVYGDRPIVDVTRDGDHVNCVYR
jgi:hypothetical protein